MFGWAFVTCMVVGTICLLTSLGVWAKKNDFTRGVAAFAVIGFILMIASVWGEGTIKFLGMEATFKQAVIAVQQASETTARAVDSAEQLKVSIEESTAKVERAANESVQASQRIELFKSEIAAIQKQMGDSQTTLQGILVKWANGESTLGPNVDPIIRQEQKTVEFNPQDDRSDPASATDGPTPVDTPGTFKVPGPTSRPPAASRP